MRSRATLAGEALGIDDFLNVRIVSSQLSGHGGTKLTMRVSLAGSGACEAHPLSEPADLAGANADVVIRQLDDRRGAAAFA